MYAIVSEFQKKTQNRISRRRKITGNVSFKHILFDTVFVVENPMTTLMHTHDIKIVRIVNMMDFVATGFFTEEANIR